MSYFINFVQRLTKLNRIIASTILFLMMLMVSIFAIARSVGYPVIGDIELIKFSMVLLIVSSLSITEATNSHVTIGLLVDHLSSRTQLILDIITQILILIFCFFVSWVYVVKLDSISSSDLLAIPYFPFKFLLILGFISWGLESLRKIYDRFSNKDLVGGE